MTHETPIRTASEGTPAVRQAGLGALIAQGLFWRSGSQIVAQLVTWAATFLIIRLLRPEDYGLFAMTQAVLFLLNMLSGTSFASTLVRQHEVARRDIAQMFGLLIVLNLGLAIAQFAVSPGVAAYYRQPIVADLLRVQCLIYLANPFLALGGALLSREMDFKRQAIANLSAAVVCALTGLAGALAGWGVWTLVAAPIAMFWTRAIGMAFAARLAILPSFDFRGTSEAIRFGLAMIASSLLWFVQTQADVFIGGRAFTAYDLGLYTTALFLAQIFTAKFVPAMNEVAFSAYARLQHDRAALGQGFARAVGLVFFVALPFHVGMALTAEPLVLTVLGQHWAGAIAPARWLAWAMPFVTLQVLFAPATNAIGRPRLAVLTSLAGAIVMPAAYAAAVAGGPEGLARVWLLAFPVLTLFTAFVSVPALGLRLATLAAALVPAAMATTAMATVLAALETLLPLMPVGVRLAILVAAGVAAYGAFALVFARGTIGELIALLPASVGTRLRGFVPA